jgi:uncharacterized membrane protein
MSTVEKLEAAVQQLSPEERAEFRAWFTEFDADEWDRQIAEDAAAGRLDWLIAEAKADDAAGRCNEL